MTNQVLLNNVDHRTLRVVSRHSAEYGDGVNQVPVFPTEFEAIQREYPIFFRQEASGDYQAVALLGLDRHENLYLSDRGWDAHYIPAIQRRGPFSIALVEQEHQGEFRHEPMIHVDLDDPRVGESEGEPLFLARGGNAPYLEHVTDVLRTIYEGLEVSGPFFAALTELELVQPVRVEIAIDDVTRYDVPDLSTIDAERLAQLTASELERLHRPGFLAAAFYVRSSLFNVNELIKRKNAKRSADHDA